MGIVGSITHSASTCAVLVGRATEYRGIGFDIELSAPPHSELADIIVGCSEPCEYRSPPLLQLIFSAKEAVYKCVYPSCKTFLDFHDIAISLDRAAGSFTAAACGAQAAAVGLDNGHGLFEITPAGAATVFTIPCKPHIDATKHH
jgi:4'-phosphopantetheinyl transferase EntD